MNINQKKQKIGKDLKKSLYNDRGAITLFVLVSLLLFIATVTMVYTFTQGKNRAINADYKQIKSKYETQDADLDKIYEAKANFKPEIVLNSRKIEESGNLIDEIYGTINLNKNETNYINDLNPSIIKYGWLYSQNSITKANLFNNKSSQIQDWNYVEKNNDQIYNIIKRETGNDLKGGFYYLCLMVDNMEFWQVYEIKVYTITLDSRWSNNKWNNSNI